MAATAGSGGLGALAIGGIATVVVVIGGVVLTRMGVFDTEAPIEAPVEQAAVVAPEASVPQVSVPEPKIKNEAVAAINTVVADPVSVPKADPAEEDVAADLTDTSAAIAVTPLAIETAGETAAETGTETEAEGATEATPEPEASVAEATSVDPEPQQVAPRDGVVVQPDNQQAAVSDTSEVAEPEGVETDADASLDAEPIAQNGAEPGGQMGEPTETAALMPLAAADPAVVDEPDFVLAAPELDLVRFDTDGAGVIAGRAQAGALVSVLLDGKVLDQFEVQAGGEFVSFPLIEPSAEVRVLSLRAAFGGQVIDSDATFILAPSVVATLVAEADTADSAAEIETEVAVVADTDDGGGTDANPDAVEVASTNVGSEDAPGAEAVEVLTRDAAEGAAAQVLADVETVATEAAEVLATSIPVTEAATEAAIEAPGTDAVKVPGEEGTTTANSIQQPASAPNSQPDKTPDSAPAAPVSAPVAMAVLRADADGVELVQPAAPLAPELVGKVALDTISYSEAGEVQLAGRAQPTSLVRVYLDNSPVADIHVTEDGRWKGQLMDVSPGIYALRLDELNPAGKVLSRLETPFKRESPEVLQPLSGPEDSPAQAAPLVRAVTVQKGDTLWAISREKYGDGLLYVRVFEANKTAIRNPDLIYPGQIFNIPE